MWRGWASLYRLSLIIIYMYIYIYIIIYILIKEAIAFFAFFAFLLFTRIWFTEIYIVWSHTGNFFSFWGYKNSYLCGCESHRRFLSFRNKKIIVWGDPPPPASRCFSQKAIAFLLLGLKNNCQGVTHPHTGVFFLFGVIRIITCAGASRTDVFFLLGIKK